MLARIRFDFTGYLSGPSLMAHLSAIDVGVIPDPPNEFNDKLSMNKVFEYMMLGLPFVQFNLVRPCMRSRRCGPVAVGTFSSGACRRHTLPWWTTLSDANGMGQAGACIAEREFHWRAEARQFPGRLSRSAGHATERQMISVIIPHLEQPQALRRCLESLCSQESPAQQKLAQPVEIDRGRQRLKSVAGRRLCLAFPKSVLLSQPIAWARAGTQP